MGFSIKNTVSKIKKRIAIKSPNINISKFKTKPKGETTRETDSLIGICLSSFGIRIVECSKSEQGLSVSALGKDDFSGEINLSNTEAVGKRLKDCLSNIDYTSGYVNIVLRDPDLKLVFRRLPYVDSTELDKIMEVEKDKEGFDAENEIIDYAVLGEAEDKEGKRLLVILVSAPKKAAYRLVSLLEDVSLQPYGIEIPTIGLARLLNFNKELNPDSSYIIINCDPKEISISLFQGSLFCLNRRIFTVGENAIVKAIAQKLDVDTPQAHKIKKEFNLNVAKKTKSGIEEQVSNAVNEILERRIIELERSIQYFTNEYPTPNIDKIFLTGNNLIQGLDGYVSKKINLPVEIIKPFKKLELPDNVSKQTKEDYSYAVATGLSLKEFVK